MKRALLLLLIPLLFLPLLVTTAKSNSNESKSEIMIIVSADNVTTFIIGEPDIDKVVIDGKDLDGLIGKFRSDVNWARRLMRKVHWEYIIISRRLDYINELVRNLTMALNATVARVNNNTLLIMRNRHDILLLAKVLNITLSELEKTNSTLGEQLATLSVENDYQWRAISSIRSSLSEREKALLAEIDRLRGEIRELKAELVRLRENGNGVPSVDIVNLLVVSVISGLVVFGFVATSKAFRAVK